MKKKKSVPVFHAQRIDTHVPSLAGNRRTWLLGGLVAVVLIGVLSYRTLLVNVAGFLIVPTDITQSDVVVPLGGGTGERLDKAADLYRAGYASKVVITGVVGVGSGGGYWLDAVLKELYDRGVAPGDVLFERKARSTYGEAVGLKSLLEEKGYKSAIVVTDPPHLRRATYVFGKVFAGSPVRLHFSSSAPAWFRAEEWWKDETNFFFVVNEYQKLIYYLMKY